MSQRNQTESNLWPASGEIYLALTILQWKTQQQQQTSQQLLNL